MGTWPNPKGVGATVLIAIALLATAHAALTPKRVLVVYQSDGYSPAALELQEGILSGLQKQLGQDVEFFCEQLEVTRFPASQGQALSWVRTRYAGRGIDVVIFVGTDFMEVLPGVPTVYASNTEFNLPGDVSLRDGQITVWIKPDIGKTIAAARRLQPDAKRVLVINGSGYEDRVLLREVQDQLKHSALPVDYLVDVPVNDLLIQVARLPATTVVLPVSYMRDLQGNIYSTRDVVALLSDASSAPVYAAGDTVIGTGPVGGYVMDFTRMGGVVADIVLQTLGGKAADRISISSEGTSAYIFDWRALRKWGFSESKLPPGSIVRFKTASMWEQYRWRIVGIAALVFAQFLLISSLLFTQRKRALAEADLRDMTGRVLASQDEERRRFARDLHDGTGQHLSAVTLAVGQVLAKFPPGHESLRKLLQDSHSASRKALEEVRTVSFALHPPMLENLGLVAATRWYLEGLQRRTNLTIDFQAPNEIRHLAPEAERALFRIVQESITNVLRHSAGDRIKVALFNREDEVTLEIEDDGGGLSAEQFAQAEGVATIGVGIAGMRERLRQLNGRFNIHSSISGTKVTATVPIDEERYAAAHSIS